MGVVLGRKGVVLGSVGLVLGSKALGVVLASKGWVWY